MHNTSSSFKTVVLKYKTSLSQLLRNSTYYKINHLDNRIANVDQLLTQDIEKFCNTLTDLYSNLSKVLSLIY